MTVNRYVSLQGNLKFKDTRNSSEGKDGADSPLKVRAKFSAIVTSFQDSSDK